MLAILLHPLTAVVLAILIVALIAGIMLLYMLMDPDLPPLSRSSSGLQVPRSRTHSQSQQEDRFADDAPP